jgi:hypothetical protein
MALGELRRNLGVVDISLKIPADRRQKKGAAGVYPEAPGFFHSGISSIPSDLFLWSSRPINLPR